MKKEKKIFFIYPPSVSMDREDEHQKPVEGFAYTSLCAPCDMMSLSAIAKIRGYQTKFKDYSLERENKYDFVRDLREYKPDFLVINTASSTLDDDLSILKEAKDILSDTLVIAKGAPFNFGALSVMQKHPLVDVALKGEIEAAFDEIISYKNLNDIEGIVYQTANKVVTTPQRKLGETLDDLVNLDRDLIDNDLYTTFDTKKPLTPIRISKGCPNHCFFCLATPLNGENVRYRSEELILAEIKECISKYGIQDFIFQSDIFTFDKARAQRLCNLIIKENLNIRFHANTRADTLDLETLRLMKKAGCSLLYMGVESGSQKILDKIGKNLTLEQIENAAKMIAEEKIPLYAYYVIGLPWETKETLDETWRFALKINSDYASFYTAAALQGSKFYNYAIQKHLAIADCTKPYILPSAQSYEISTHEIIEYHKKFNKNYYIRPKYVLKALKDFKTPARLRAYFETVFELLKQD